MLQRLQTIAINAAFLAAALILAFVIARSIGSMFPAVEAEEIRGAQHRYSIERFRWQDRGFTVRIGDKTRFDLPRYALSRVKLRKWLPGDRGVLIEIAADPYDVLLLYDFEQRSMHSCGTGNEWKEWPLDERRTPFKTCEQLHAYSLTLSPQP
ncbi:MAG: hypothetical protein FJW38_12370 [Acidobacteria bacterium]|nr:hypothetical protein [Acidobacteriota bacterium]